MHPASLHKYSRVRIASLWGLILLALTLLYTLFLASSFFMSSVNLYNYPSPLTLIRQGVNTKGTLIVSFESQYTDLCGSDESFYDITLHYQDIHNMTHTVLIGCTRNHTDLSETVAIRYVPGYSGVDFQQDYQSMIEYYLRLAAIITGQILLAIILFIITVNAHLKPAM